MKPYPFNLIDDLMLGEDFYSELSDGEIIEEVDNLLLKLSDKYVRNKHIPRKMLMVIHLRYVEGLTYSKIGEVLGISSSRVGQIKNRVLRILRHPSRLNRLLLKTDEPRE